HLLAVRQREACLLEALDGALAHLFVAAGDVENFPTYGEHALKVVARAGDRSVVAAVLAGEEPIAPEGLHLRVELFGLLVVEATEARSVAQVPRVHRLGRAGD